MSKKKSRSISQTEKLLITARYDTEKAFDEEVEYVLENMQDNPGICSEHEKLDELDKLFLPDYPAEFDKQVKKQKLQKDLEACVGKLVSNWEYMESEHEQCLQGVNIWLKEVDGPYAVVAPNSQTCDILRDEIDANDLFERIIPDIEDLIFFMKGYPSYAKILVQYQPSCPEVIYIRPAEKYIRSKVSYNQILKIIQENKQEFTYWNVYPAQFDEESMLECIVMAIQEEMIPWKWPEVWFKHKK